MTIKQINFRDPYPTPALSSRLVKLEAAIEDGISTFMKVGKALVEINKDRLYRERGFRTFESYCKVKWGISRQYAYRQIQAVKVVQNLSPHGDNLPVNEAQARELVGLLPSEQCEVATNVVFYTATPAQVREIVQTIKPNHTTTHIQPKVCDAGTAQDFIAAGLRRFTACELLRAIAALDYSVRDVVLDMIKQHDRQQTSSGGAA